MSPWSTNISRYHILDTKEKCIFFFWMEAWSYYYQQRIKNVVDLRLIERLCFTYSSGVERRMHEHMYSLGKTRLLHGMRCTFMQVGQLYKRICCVCVCTRRGWTQLCPAEQWMNSLLIRKSRIKSHGPRCHLVDVIRVVNQTNVQNIFKLMTSKQGLCTNSHCRGLLGGHEWTLYNWGDLLYGFVPFPMQEFPCLWLWPNNKYFQKLQKKKSRAEVIIPEFRGLFKPIWVHNA